MPGLAAAPILKLLLLLPCYAESASLLNLPPARPAQAAALLQQRNEERSANDLSNEVVQGEGEEVLAGTTTLLSEYFKHVIERAGEETMAGAATLLSEYFKHVIEHAGSPEAWMSFDKGRFESLAMLQQQELERACTKMIPQDAVRHQVAHMVRKTLHKQPNNERNTAGQLSISYKEAAELRESILRQAPFLRQWDMYDQFVRGSMETVLGWPVLAAVPEQTDRVAVAILLEGIKGKYIDHNAQYVIRSVMHRLGPRWALHIFHGKDRRLSLEKALGFPANVMWTTATVDGEPVEKTRDSNSQVRWSRDFYKAIPERHEHILIFELDSLLLQKNCVEQFLDYDLVGAPGRHPPFPQGSMNGGFTLRRRSTFWKAVNLYNYSEARHLDPSDNPNEDSIAAIVLSKMGANVAPEEVAKNFAFESVPNSTSCAFHKPWAYSDMYDDMRAALAYSVF